MTENKHSSKKQLKQKSSFDKRKRVRCKMCGKRVNLVYYTEGNKIYFTCPNCFQKGELKINKRI